MLSPSTSALGVAADELAPMRNAWARPSGAGCTAYVMFMPQWLPSPSSSAKRGVSCGVEMIEDVADARQHQRAERVVDHRLVVDRQQLLADSASVTGYRRVPEPPARMMPLRMSVQIICSSSWERPSTCQDGRRRTKNILAAGGCRAASWPGVWPASGSRRW